MQKKKYTKFIYGGLTVFLMGMIIAGFISSQPPAVKANTSPDTRSRFVAALGSKYRQLNNIVLTPQQWSMYKNCFPDMINHIHESEVCYVTSLGFVSGFADGTFKPDNAVSRAEAAKIFTAAFLKGQIHPLANTKQLYGDVSLNMWFASYVNTLAQNNKVDYKPYPSLAAPDLSKSKFFPSYTMSVSRTSYWLSLF